MIDNDILNDVEMAQAGGGGSYIRDGKYLLAIKKLEIKRAGASKHRMAILEFKVLQAQKTETDVEPNVVGSTASVVWNLDKHVSSKGNLKAFLVALDGRKEDQFKAGEISQLMTAAFDPQKNPMRGWVIGDETYRGTIKSTGKPIVKNKWITVAQTDAEIATRRAEIEKDGV